MDCQPNFFDHVSALIYHQCIFWFLKFSVLMTSFLELLNVLALKFHFLQVIVLLKTNDMGSLIRFWIIAKFFMFQEIASV